MEDVENGSYLIAGGIWTELNRRKSFARLASIKDLLQQHLTRTLYDRSRADVLQLISRKITYKEKLIERQDVEFSDQLHKSISNAEGEINTLLGFIMAFDSMAELMEKEAAHFVDEWYQTKHRNLILDKLLTAQNERVDEWRNLSFDLHDHILTNLKPTAHA